MLADLALIAAILWIVAITGWVRLPRVSMVWRAGSLRDPIYLLLALIVVSSVLGWAALYAEYGWKGLTEEDPGGRRTEVVGD